jgi:hypothetical protein
MITLTQNTPVTVTQTTQTTIPVTNINVSSIVIMPEAHHVACTIQFLNPSDNSVLDSKVVQFSSVTSYEALFSAFPILSAQIRNLAVQLAQQANLIPSGAVTDDIFGQIGVLANVPSITDLKVV